MEAKCELCESEIDSWDEYRICIPCIDMLLDGQSEIIQLLRKVSKKHFIYGDTVKSGQAARALEDEVKKLLAKLEKQWGHEAETSG